MSNMSSDADVLGRHDGGLGTRLDTVGVPQDDAAAPTLEPRRMLPSLRVIGPSILIAGVVPLIGYQLLRPHVGSDATALSAMMVFPIGEITFQRVRHHRFEPIGIISLFGIVFGLSGTLAFHGDALLLKLRESVLTGLFGAACLASIFARRPIMFYAGRAFATGGDKTAHAAFDAIWARPGAPARFRRTTAIWGIGLLAETAARTYLALTISTSRFLAAAPILGFGTIGTLIWISARSIRAGERHAADADAATVTALTAA